MAEPALLGWVVRVAGAMRADVPHALAGGLALAVHGRYAHLFDDPLRQATERVGAIIAGKPGAEVRRLRK